MAAPKSGGASLGKPAPPATPHRYDFAHEVATVLTQALARDDERRRHIKHCPHCGHSLLENLS